MIFKCSIHFRTLWYNTICLSEYNCLCLISQGLQLFYSEALSKSCIIIRKVVLRPLFLRKKCNRFWQNEYIGVCNCVWLHSIFNFLFLRCIKMRYNIKKSSSKGSSSSGEKAITSWSQMPLSCRVSYLIGQINNQTNRWSFLSKLWLF